jgi:hypothetical protein
MDVPTNKPNIIRRPVRYFLALCLIALNLSSLATADDAEYIDPPQVGEKSRGFSAKSMTTSAVAPMKHAVKPKKFGRR